MSKVSITRSLLDDLAMSISAKSGEAVPLTLTEMKDAVDGIQTGGGGSVTQDQDGYIVLPSTGGGGGDITVEALSVTQNGAYTAQTGHAYSPVTVSVPNTYSVSDEGKVVSSGALVSQTSDTYTTNGTYDTTLINSITVNVSGGGGLEYETGTFTPTSDVTSPYINFSDTHTDYPIYINMVDTTETLASENSMLTWTFINWYDAFNTHILSTSSANLYGRYTAQWKTSSGVSYNNTDCTSTSGNSGGLYYLLDNTQFVPYGFGSSRYWRAGRTYKWIAVWAPTA